MSLKMRPTSTAKKMPCAREMYSGPLLRMTILSWRPYTCQSCLGQEAPYSCARPPSASAPAPSSSGPSSSASGPGCPSPSPSSPSSEPVSSPSPGSSGEAGGAAAPPSFRASARYIAFVRRNCATIASMRSLLRSSSSGVR